MPATNDQARPVDPPHAVGAAHPDEDQLQRSLQSVIRFAVRILSILMTFVILWGVADVAYVLWENLAAVVIATSVGYLLVGVTTGSSSGIPSLGRSKQVEEQS